MSYSTTIGVDLAKNVIQVSAVSSRGEERLNRSLTRRKFAELLVKQQPALVAFEACATSHYWARAAQRHGHTARIIPAKAVAPFRQGHKTDSNDALAVAEAARRPNIKEAPMKTVDQQGLQAIQRSRELLVQESTALSNHLRGLLMEFGEVIPRGFAALQRQLRSVLIQGARSYVNKLKEPKTPKDRWLMELIERAGPGKATVALANKNFRTAWALLTQGTEYQRQPQLKVVA